MNPYGAIAMSNAVFVLSPGSVYEQDLFVWAKEQAHLLEEGRFGELDLENLIEEVRTVGGSDKREIYSRMEVLIAHLLQWRYRPGRRTPSWQTTIRHQRTRIGKIVDDSPSLRRYPASELSDVYVGGRLRAADETGIDFTLFPPIALSPSIRCLTPSSCPTPPTRAESPIR